MRVFETAHDHCVLPGIYMVARIDGRCFSTLTKEEHNFQAPYDERFKDYMLSAMHRLMKCGFRIQLAYSQSDEINLLFHQNEESFSRKLRKYNSILAGECSAAFSMAMGHPVAFDCRISQLPSQKEVINYFRWRQDDAARNALNSHCYWYYRSLGKTDREAHELLMGVSNADKNEILFSQANINFNDLPCWQRRGFALRWDFVEHEGVNPMTGLVQKSHKKEIVEDLELPMKDQFEDLVRLCLQDQS